MFASAVAKNSVIQSSSTESRVIDDYGRAYKLVCDRLAEAQNQNNVCAIEFYSHSKKWLEQEFDNVHNFDPCAMKTIMEKFEQASEGLTNSTMIANEMGVKINQRWMVSLLKDLRLSLKLVKTEM